MKSAKPIHHLTNIDRENRRAICSVCGLTAIYIWTNHPYAGIKCSCINRMRESHQDYKQRLWQKQGLPEPKRNKKPRHLLSQIDTEKLRAVCSVCGPTDIRKHNTGEKYYYCNTKKREDTAARRRSKGIPLPNPSHHRLSQVDLENKTATCSKCGGRVKIYVIRQGNKIKRRCSNATVGT